MSPNWFLRWRLRRAERALAEARSRREARDLENPDYGGLLAEQVVEERRLEERVDDLKQRVEPTSPDDGYYCLKCGRVSQWTRRGCTVCRT
jgi:hypothetical protein